MKTFLPVILSAAALVVLAAGAGCGGAQATADDDGAAGTSHAGLACSALDPDADVCAFGFAPDAARVVSGVTAFAKSARDMRSDVEAACRGALADLGRDQPADGRACEAVNHAIGGAVARLEIHVDEPRCEAAPPPACMRALGPSPTICRGGAVIAIAPDDATPFESLVAALLSRRYGSILRADRQIEPTVDMTGSFSGSISAVASLPAECTTRVTAMVTGATEDVQRAVPEIRDALVGILPPR